MKRSLILILSLIFIFSGIFNTGCKTTYDITGTWNITFYIVGVPAEGLITFIGSKSSGTVNNILFGEMGTYQVNGSVITFSAQLEDDYNDVLVLNATGTITDDNNMQGTFSYHYTLFPNVNLAGTWIATR
ncbi:MAG: hypothetical protein KAS21_04385 [Candidatus Aminicenantes bacterium]|nr:hypothetical protein [Candidatus Aminicenantes bacterium]MCK5004299.1 hypothetical protein [Candidatus Aminicenantes bacterium]